MTTARSAAQITEAHAVDTLDARRIEKTIDIELRVADRTDEKLSMMKALNSPVSLPDTMRAQS